uniref:PDZ domain-containing protein n=1 Tax=Oryzias latipes TaxID=8090 RepID=A0A3P9LFF7_ORYLA
MFWQPRHRRGRSLSEALTLEQLEEGGVFVSSISNPKHSQGLKEGDEIMGATINFDQLSKEEVLKVLKLMEPFEDKIQVHTRSNLSKSLGNLDECTRDPEKMLTDSYSKLYKTKIKKFLKDDLPSAEGSIGSDESTVPAASKVKPKNYTELPRLGVDFGLVKSKTPNRDANADSTDDTSMNLPSPSLGFNDGSQSYIKEPRLELNTPKTFPEGPTVKTVSDPEVDRDVDVGFPMVGTDLNRGEIPTTNANSPQLNIEGTSPLSKVPKFNFPKLSISGPSLNGPEGQISLPGVATKEEPSGKLSLKKSKRLKHPDLNLDDPSSFVEFLQKKSGDLDLDSPSNGLPNREFSFKTQGDVKGPEKKATDLSRIKGPSKKYKPPKFEMPKFDLPDIPIPDLEEDFKLLNTPDKGIAYPDAELDIQGPSGKVSHPDVNLKMPELQGPDWDVNGPSGKLKMPKMNLSGTLPKGPNLDADLTSPDFNLKAPKVKGGINTPDVDLPNVDLKSSKMDMKTPDVDIGSPKAKFKFPKMKMPKFNLPTYKSPEVDAKLDHPDFNVNGPNLNLRGPKADVDADVSGPSGKFKKPNFDLPEFDVSEPKVKGGIDAPDIKLPKMDPKTAKLDFNAPDVNLKMPELQGPDWDVNGPSGKLKMPKMNLSGTLPKGPNLDPDLTSPDFNLKAPKVKGGINTPDVDLPNVDLKSSKMDMKTPDGNIGSPKGKFKFPKMKMPNFNLPTFKGTEVDAKLDHPDLHATAPNLDLRGPKADVDADVSGPSWKFKKPNFDLPEFDVSGPKVKGGIDAPDIKLPKMDPKTPKLDFNAPDVNLKMPELQGPDWDVNGPSGKLKMPKMNLSETLPKGPNLDADLTSPDFNPKAPKVKGGINTPDVDLPNVDLKSSKLNMKTPDVDIGSPKGKFKFPKMKMPNFNLPTFKGPEVNAQLDHPDFNVNGPNLNLRGPKADVDADVSGPSWKFKKPNFDLPEFDVSGPKVKGGIDAPDIKLSKVDFKTPKLDLNAPDVNLDMPSGNLKMPELQGPDWDVNAPSGKLKMPKMNLSGTLPKGANLDADLTSPDFNLKAPKVKGGINTPGMDLHLDHKGPNFGANLPGVSTASPKAKLKMPKVGLSSMKGQGIDGNFDRAGLPNADIKHSKKGFEVPEVDFGKPSRKLKMPDIGFSKPKFDSPDLELNSPSLKAKIPKESNMKLSSDFQTPDLSLKIPKGSSDSPKLGLPDVDFKAPKMDISTPDVDVGVPDIQPKMPKMKMVKDMNGSDITIPNGDVFEPKLKGRGALDLHGTQVKGPRLDIQDKQPDFQMWGDMGQPSINFTSSKMKDFRGPNPGMNFPSADVRGSQPDLKLADRKFKLPSFKMPQYGGTNIHNMGCDIDFGESLQPKTLSPPNATLNTRSGTMQGNLTGPRVTPPNMLYNMPKAVIPNSQPHYRSSGLDLDYPPTIFQRPPDQMYPNVSMTRPGLDIDPGVRLRTDRKASRSNVRSSYPAANAALHPHMDGRRLDLNIDDFTGKDHVLRARGSNLDLYGKHDYGQMIPTSQVHVDTRDYRKPRAVPDRGFGLPALSQNSQKVPPHSSDGYLVTVFPNQTPNSKMQNLKHNSPKRQSFLPGTLDLDVPYQNNPKGSTFFFSNVV